MTELHYDRIEKVTGALNAVVERMTDEAYLAADAADRAVAAGAELGPLHGVPLSAKEDIDVAGWATTQGVLARRVTVLTDPAGGPTDPRISGAIRDTVGVLFPIDPR